MDLCSLRLKLRRAVTVRRFFHPPQSSPFFFPTTSSSLNAVVASSSSSSAVRSYDVMSRNSNPVEHASFSGNAEERWRGGGDAEEEVGAGVNIVRRGGPIFAALPRVMKQTC